MEQSFIRSLFGFSGRMNRLRFFLRLLFLIVFVFAFYFLMSLTAPAIRYLGIVGVFLGLFLIFLMLFVIPVLLFVSWYSLYVKRAHDIGLSALWIVALFALSVTSLVVEFSKILPLLPYIKNGSEYEMYLWALNYKASAITTINQIVQFVALLALLFWPGPKNTNRYGRNPKANAESYAEEVFGEKNSDYYYHTQSSQEHDLTHTVTPVRPFAETIQVSHSGSKGTKLSVTRKPKN